MEVVKEQTSYAPLKPIVYLSDALREQSAKIDVFSAPAMTPFRSIELGGTIL